MGRDLIEVTKEDIKLGEQCSGNTCPIARAVKRKYGMEANEYIEVQENCVDLGILWTRYYLPRSAQRFINKFDKGEPVKPFKFYLVKDN